MSGKSVLGPFRPGPGGMPPYLAGRESEQALFRGLLEDLTRGIPPETQVVLYGPRGNGKTVLLRWLEAQARARPGVQIARVLPSELASPERLVELLLPSAWWDRLTPQELALAGFSWKGRGAGSPPSVADVLAVRARKSPFLLLVDEAHTLDVGVGRVLWNASQLVAGDQPFLLVVAGTPDLQGRLNAMGASFWSRAEQLALGRLGAEAAGEGFRRPFEAEAMRVEEDALARLVEASHGYPFFVQLLGSAVWDCASAGGAPPRSISRSVVEAARGRFEQRRDAYYQHRFDELEARDLLPVGVRVAEAFEDRSEVSLAELGEAIARGLGDADGSRVRNVRRILSDLGYIWGPGPTPSWQPGIPSLLDYVRKHAP